MFSVKDTLLPTTATPLARALDILEERLFGLPVQMISKNAATVDVRLLDHLAWEHSVDVWDMEWPEDIKRRVVAASAEVHRFKGTPYAIREALAAFDVDSELLEWFQPQGVQDGLEAGSFRVTAYAGGSLYGANENTIDNRMIGAMTAVVQRVAPVSRALVFRLGERFQTDVRLQCGVQVVGVHSDKSEPQTRPLQAENQAVLRAAVCVREVFKETHELRPRPSSVLTGVGVRMASTARAISAQIHDVQRRAVA